MHVPEQAAFLGLSEGRPAPELADAPDVVEQCSGEEEIVAKPRVELRRLAGERRDAHRVLEQAAGVAVVAVGSTSRKGSQRISDLRVCDERADESCEPVVADLGREEVEEAVELVEIAP